MIANYYTLRHLARQLDQRLNGSSIREIFSQNENELIVSFENPLNQGENSGPAFLVVHCEPSQNCVFLAESFARAKRNSVDLLPSAIGFKVLSITIHHADRQITIALNEGLRLVVQMFGSKANVLVAEEDNKIVESFLRQKENEGQTLQLRDVRGGLTDKASVTEQLREFGEISVGVAIKKIFPRFDSTLLEELFHRTGIARSEAIDRLSDDELRRIAETGEEIAKELESTCDPRVYYDGPSAIAFSIIELKHCRQFDDRAFASLSAAIRTFLGTTKSLNHAAHEKARIEQGIRKVLERTARTLVKISEETDSNNRAGTYERMGELIKAHIHEIQKGSVEVILEDTIDGSENLVTVPLDKNLTPAKNAERYFEKAKKARVSVAEKSKQKTKLVAEKSALTVMLEGIKKVESSAEIETFVEDHREQLVSLSLVKPAHSKRAIEEQVPFRVFRVFGDFVVWAGKSGENNDLLSTRYTKSKDLWFHARAVGGSHVVLKFGSGKGEMSKRTIGEAASIAAFYSKMKNSKMVPVSVCEGKYVRKPKGAPAGTVTIDREKVLFVEPGLPAEH